MCGKEGLGSSIRTRDDGWVKKGDTSPLNLGFGGLCPVAPAGGFDIFYAWVQGLPNSS
jgi:hypothetical protein